MRRLRYLRQTKGRRESGWNFKQTGWWCHLSRWLNGRASAAFAGVPGSIPAWGVCDFFRFCQSFTSNFPFPFPFSFPFPSPFDLSFALKNSFDRSGLPVCLFLRYYACLVKIWRDFSSAIIVSLTFRRIHLLQREETVKGSELTSGNDWCFGSLNFYS